MATAAVAAAAAAAAVCLAVISVRLPAPALGSVLSPVLTPIADETLSSTDSHLKFLPCVIPNCTLNYSCMKSPASAEEKTKQANESILNPCHWVDCGGGSCNMTSIISYSCLCDEGYHNLFNLDAFPCYTQCAIGMDCLNLGISSSNNTALAPTLADSDGSRGSLMRGSSHWLVALMFFLGILQCP
ncbi:hypothetical protein NL676_029546 [Syzygium grande]|nr:hypothetical protein NL676_029546 [Syzygium grande]